VNPIILLLISVLLGTLFHDKVKLDSPIMKSLITNEKNYEIASILKYGVFGGLISGALITTFSLISAPYLPTAIVELSENIDVTLANRFLYGGITEEILVRFGLMTFLIWLLSRIFKTFTPKIYWIGILVSSIIFGFGHFPIAFQAVAEPSMLLLLYILIGNSIGGIIFGWLYWKKGLESAMIAHIFTHIVMVLASFL
jgi:membrane protease YdiL (CAAX protease family)